MVCFCDKYVSCNGRNVFVHEISKPYPKYSRAETDDKIRHAVEEKQAPYSEFIKTKARL